jgi:hypothetical protein
VAEIRESSQVADPAVDFLQQIEAAERGKSEQWSGVGNDHDR